MENKVKNVLSGIGFYGTLAVCLLVVGVCGWVLLQDREDPLPQQAVTPQVPVSQPVEMPEVRLPTVETLEPAPVPVPPKETKELPEVEVDHTPVAAEAPRLVVAPLRGDVLTAFSMEELVYSPTLGDWRTHNGVDIAAQQRHGRIRALGKLQHRRDARRDDGQALDVLEHGRQHIARLARAEEHGLPCLDRGRCLLRDAVFFLIRMIQDRRSLQIALRLLLFRKLQAAVRALSQSLFLQQLKIAPRRCDGCPRQCAGLRQCKRALLLQPLQQPPLPFPSFHTAPP